MLKNMVQMNLKLQKNMIISCTRERTELDKEFDKKVDFQTSIRGLKVRGVF